MACRWPTTRAFNAKDAKVREGKQKQEERNPTSTFRGKHLLAPDSPFRTIEFLCVLSCRSLRKSNAMMESFASGVVLEGHQDPGAECDDFAAIDLHVHFHHFCDAQIAQALGGGLHGVGRGVFPGLGAGSNHFDNFVDLFTRVLLGHDIPPSCDVAREHTSPRREPMLHRMIADVMTHPQPRPCSLKTNARF